MFCDAIEVALGGCDGSLQGIDPEARAIVTDVTSL
jgi:hypothetical protein